MTDIQLWGQIKVHQLSSKIANMVINRLRLNLSMRVNKHGTVMENRVNHFSSPEPKAPGELIGW